MPNPRASAIFKQAALFGALLFLFTAGMGCALYRDDRCFVPPDQYSMAHDLFVQTGSLDLVHRRMVDLEWETCKINETLYRLQKEFQVLPEGTPAPAPPGPAAAAAK